MPRDHEEYSFRILAFQKLISTKNQSRPNWLQSEALQCLSNSLYILIVMKHHDSTQPARSCDVMLRDVQPADVPILFAFESDPAWCAMAMVKPRSAAAFNAVWEKIAQGCAKGDPVVAQKVIVADGEVCGTIGCRALDGQFAVGYGLGQAFWGRGIASRALGLLLAEVPQRPLHAVAAVTNTASIRVLMKHGFVIEATRASPETERHLACEEVCLVLA
ncbi:MAG: hypothetical protein DHS20C16_09720 [Phycisphaerae bacterium]|nr:MAG: hypothetical protein DHS20C16_09720 [Phycisphaerae bacterium]